MLFVYLTGLIASLLLFIRYLDYRGTARTNIDRRSKQQRSDYGFIYFYTHRFIWRIFPVVKIGRAGTAEKRLAPQKTPAPFGLKLFAVVMVKDEVRAENYIHRRYRLERIWNDRRNEWFWLTPRVYTFMKTVKDAKHTKRVRKASKTW